MSQKLNKAEKELYYWKIGTAGSFMSSLFFTLGKADSTNFAKLSLGFPDEANAYYRYANEDGYWESVEKRMQESL